MMMKISTQTNTIVISGNIKSISDLQTIKQSIDGVVKNHKNIIIKIEDSLSITSSVIGYLNKLVLKDGVEISMMVGNSQLMHLLEDLNLISMFNVKMVY